MGKTQSRILSKRNLLIFIFVLNVAILVTASFFKYFWIYPCVGAFTALVMLPFIASNNFVTHKMSTLLINFAFPLFGITLYVLTKSRSKVLFGRREWQDLNYKSAEYLIVNESSLDNLKRQNLIASKISTYCQNYFNAPLYQNSSTQYISGADNFYVELFKEIKDAKKYIFIEAYKIWEGEVWNKLFELLKQKAREGVEIKILYNPKTNKNAFTDKLTFKKLINFKIEARPFRSSLYGFSSHRKMVVIDGVVAFVGGNNIFDKHVQVTTEVGNWRQSSLKIVGDASWGLSTLFLNSWQFAGGKLNKDYLDYRPEIPQKAKSNEFVQPLSISPLANRNEIRDLYLNLINNAESHITIVSSCVLIDSLLAKALSNAVKSGVEVSLVVSNNSDRYNLNIMGRGYYEGLIRDGVKIYEYNNGAVRSKLVSIDGITAMVGTTNLDVRKLNASFECTALVHGKDIIKDIDKDINNIIEGCRLLSLKEVREDSFGDKLKGKTYKFFAS